MIRLTRRIFQAGEDVLGFEKLVIREDLLLRFTCAQQAQHIRDAQPKAANARTPAAFTRLDRDARKQFRIHARRLRAARLFASASFQSGVVSAGGRIEDFVHLFLLRRRRMSL